MTAQTAQEAEDDAAEAMEALLRQFHSRIQLMSDEQLVVFAGSLTARADAAIDD